MKRKTPVRHTVRSHKREGKIVKSFKRGSGKLSRRSKVVGVKTGMKRYSEGGWREYFPDGSYIWATYDRHYRMWSVTYNDKDGNQVGDAEYQVDRDSAIRNIKTDHRLDGPPTIQYKKLTKSVLKKIFNTEDVSVKRTTGFKYDRITYHVYTPERRVVIWEYRWRNGKLTGKKDFFIKAEKATDIKRDTPEYKSLLKKHGSLTESRGTVYEPEFEYEWVDELTLRKHIESVT